MTATPAIEGWFTTGEEPALLASSCTTCEAVWFPPVGGPCRDPRCTGSESEPRPLGRRGTVWSYTDAQYQPPPPYLAPTGEGGYVPFAIAAVELPEGLVVLGQVADGYGVSDLSVGTPVEVVVETLYTDADGTARSVWRWKPVGGAA